MASGRYIFELPGDFHVRLNAPQAPFTQVVRCWQTKIIYPLEIVGVILVRPYQEQPLVIRRIFIGGILFALLPASRKRHLHFAPELVDVFRLKLGFATVNRGFPFVYH